MNSSHLKIQLIVLEYEQEETYNLNKRVSLSISSLLVSVLLVIVNNSLLAQDSTKSIKNNHHFSRISYQYGTVLKTSDFTKGKNLTGEPIDNYQAARIEFGWQKTGSKMWHAIWNYPTFGLGFYGVNYIDEEQLGNPIALYGFTEWPLIRNRDIIFCMQLGFGLSFNWKPFDLITNPFNEAIGNFQAVYIDVGITLDYIISNQIGLVTALTVTHFSNGGSKQPNWGLNQLGLMAMVKYKFPSEDLPYTKYDIPDYEDSNEWLIAASWGTRNVHIDSPVDVPELPDKYLRVDYSVFTITSTYYLQTTWKSKFGFGIDLVHDKSVSGQVDAGDGQVEDINVPFEDEFRVGLYGAYEIVLYDISIFLNLGYSIFQQEDQLPRLYQRLGLKFHFTDRFFLGLNARFMDFGKSNHLEFNAGYRLQWR